MTRAFLNYSREDADFAGFFETMFSLGASEVQLWMDERLDAGARFPEEIMRQIASCDLFIAALSPAWARSDWCQRELRAALAREPDIEIIPLLIDELEIARTELAAYQAIDLRQWRIEGDLVLRAQLLHRFSGPGPAPPPGPAQLEALRRLVLWGARSETPDEIGRDLADLATWQIATAPDNPLPRARLLDALAGLHLTRREWRDMVSTTQAALRLLHQAGWPAPHLGSPYEPGDLTDDDLAFLGELHNRLALGARELGRGEGVTELDRALAVFTAIRHPLLRREKTAQAHREWGTWAQRSGDLETARHHFQLSGDLLKGLPSQQLHVLQAEIKQAQVDLQQGKHEQARARLDRVAPWFAEGAAGDGLLAAQVRPHYLITEAAWATVTGHDTAARQALDRLDRDGRLHTSGRSYLRRTALRLALGLPVRLRLRALQVTTARWRLPSRGGRSS